MKLVLTAVLLLSACTTAKQVHTPDGKVGHAIDCTAGSGGRIGTWADCYAKAGEICGTKGYTVLAGGAETGASFAGGGGFIGGGTHTTRSMVIQCKP